MPVLLTPLPSEAPIQNGVVNTNGIMDLMWLVFVLILILAAAFYVTKFIGKFSLNQIKNSNFKVIDTYRISPNKFLQIVKVADKFVVIAVGKDTVTYITELEESEVYIKDVNAKENISFKQILEKVRNKTQ